MKRGNAKLMDGEFEELNALFQVKLLSQRVETLGREKEEIERDFREADKRLDNIERVLAIGWGVVLVVGILGTVFGFLFAYRTVIFGPWIRSI